MSLTRETIYGAVFARLQTLGPSPAGSAIFVTVSRRLRHWSDVTPALQPAVYLVQRQEKPRQDKGRPPVWELGVDLYLYVHAPDQTQPAAPLLNRALDAVEAAFAPDPTGVNTLGGLVSRCWIDQGGIETDEGTLGDQAVAIIPLSIEATA
jgi:hypothetical protein